MSIISSLQGGEKVKHRVLKVMSYIIGLIFLLTLISSSTAAVVWSDNFDDGNYNGWTVATGDWRVTDGYLESYYVDTALARMWHPSTVVEGTWSFDVHFETTSETLEADYMFMVNGSEGPDDYYGYGLRLSGSSFYFVRQSGGFNTLVSLAFTIVEDIVDTWTHVDITRNSASEFNVFFNETSSEAEPVLSVTDTTYDYSERFVVNAIGIGICMVDNITVNDQILITPPEPTPTTTTPTETPSETPTTGDGTPPPIDSTLLIVGGGVAAVVIIGAVVCLKRR